MGFPFPRLAKLASDLRSALRSRQNARDRDDGEWVRSLAELARKAKSRLESPPIQDDQRFPAVRPPVHPEKEFELEYEDEPETTLPTYGRGASHDREEWELVRSRRRLVQSSNVYAYYFLPETRNSGILYVTFLYWEEGMKSSDRSGPGPTYAYYDFPIEKYKQFERATQDSAGKAVWDYCRIRGSQHGHQHRYTLVQAEGDYVPRKATALGFAARTLLAIGEGRYNPELMRRSTLEPRRNGGEPNRGTPNRGTPNRGR